MNRQTLGRADSVSRREWQRWLALGPWLWPKAGSPDMERALALVSTGPREPSVGVVPLVSVWRDATRGSCTVTLWKLEPSGVDTTDHGVVGFKPATERLWREAGSEMSRVVPLLWQPAVRRRGERPVARRMAAWLGSLAGGPLPVAPSASGTRQELREHVLDGESFGLAFMLSHASLAMSQPVRPDVITSARVVNGRVLPVGHIAEKVQGICTLAPRLTRLLVHPGDVAEARRAAAGRLRVVAVPTIGAALRYAFRKPVAAMFVAAGRDQASRDELVSSLFQIATGPRVELIDWTPVRRAAELALQRWPLSTDERHRLALSAAFAERHETNGGRVTLPPRRLLERLPRATRIDLAAHLVSHCAYAGSPSVRAVRRLVRTMVPDSVHEALVPELKLMGALARLDAVTGEPGPSLHWQLLIAEQFVRIGMYSETSYNLSEAYRLAGVLGDKAAFEHVAQLEARVERLGGFDLGNRPFVLIARAQALTRLGRPIEAEPTLRVLSENRSGPSHIRWSAIRTLVALIRAGGRPDAARPLEARLARAARSSAADTASAQMYLALARLDRALAEERTAEAVRLVGEARRLEPGVIGHLARAARQTGAPVPHYVAMLYPD